MDSMRLPLKLYKKDPVMLTLSVLKLILWTSHITHKIRIFNLMCSFQIGIVAFDGEAQTPKHCYSDRLALSIPVNIQAMEDFVNSIPLSTGGTSGESSYSKAFHTAFQFFINSYKKDDERGETDDVDLFLF